MNCLEDGGSKHLRSCLLGYSINVALPSSSKSLVPQYQSTRYHPEGWKFECFSIGLVPTAEGHQIVDISLMSNIDQ
jgi:hypothetical protein